MATLNCIVCGNTNFNSLYNDVLLKCSACGFVTANIDIKPEALQEIYSEKYFKGEEYSDYLNDKNVLQKNFRHRLRKIKKTFPGKKMNNAMEIGCAYGFFGETLLGNFPHGNYIGFDIAKEAISYGRNNLKLNLVDADYLSVNPPASAYSDVFMWDVIEHLEHPEQFLTKIHNELETKGRLFITTGDIDALVPRIQKARWRMIHPPSHLHYLSKKTITALLEKKGFRVVKVAYSSVHRSIKQIFYSLFILNKKERKFLKKIYNLIPEKMSIPINTFDIMFVMAEKI